ncbi:MAG: coproporphyrinogen dehydrogenase HemZ [Ruminococcaceae bacterium]|nr:coproporphyrinogen dehydrogenase HemZ [Oscillospiraceae bacterium]
MNIYITGNGKLNAYYVQTLCLLYFPGEGFKESENSRWCKVHSERCENNSFAVVQLGDSEIGCAYVGKGSVDFSSLTSADIEKSDKIAVGLAFMDAAGKFTGYTPPWGILTGVRPARVVSALIDEGLSPDDASNYLINIYRVSEDKARLATSVSVTESAVIKKDQRNECSIYIAIPFCPSRCRYCSFVSVSSPGLLKLIPEYLIALKRDLTNTIETINSLGLHVSSVYVGGGTPTILDASQIDYLLSFVRESVGYEIEEFTFEAGRPDTITKEKLEAIKRNNVTRISVNTQTLNDDVLKNVGRNHTAADFLAAYELSRDTGIKCINVDLIAGLPGESAESFISSANQIAELQPDAITVHTFTVKRSSDYGMSDLYSRESLDAERSVSEASRIISDFGYIPYYMYRQKNTVGNLENVGFSLPGCESMYNIYMMEEIHTVFGVGASAVTRLTLHDKRSGEQIIERIFEPKYPYEYLKDHDGETGEKRRLVLRTNSKKFYENHG